MLSAILSLTSLGLVFGLILGVAARLFRVETAAHVAEFEADLPGTNCGQCGFPGCAGAAAALAIGKASATCCPPGGKAVAEALAARLGVKLDAQAVNVPLPVIAKVHEDICIGCTRCIKVCPTDAIIGAMKQIHAVVGDACSGCSRCEPICPTGAIQIAPLSLTVNTWVWPRPTLT